MRRFYPVFLALAFLASSCIFAPNSSDSDAGQDVLDTTGEDVIGEDTAEEDAFGEETVGEDTVEEDTVEEDVQDVEADTDACGGCEGETPHCDTGSGTCVECLTEAECGGQDVCSADGECVTCTEGEGCGDGVCVVDEADAANNVCTECEDGDDCSDDEVCAQGDDITDNVCAACVDGDGCGADQVCSVDADEANNNVCVECLDDVDCAGEQVCAIAPDDVDNVCVRCLDSEDCGSDQVCAVDSNDATSNVCVGCLGDADCADGVCIEGAMPEGNACRPCREATDCTEADAAACNTGTNSCEACSENDDCAGVSGLGVCDGGMCVECVSDSDCGGKVCDQTNNTCTTIDPGTADVCETCVADTQCPQEHYCVPMDFAGAAHGNYCLKVFDNVVGCDQPHGILETKTSLGGVNDEFCSLNESLTTCEALESLEAGAANQCGSGGMPDDSLCGASGVDDGLCRTVGGLINKCTYACDVVSDCPDINNRDTCGNQRNGGTGPDYCGGGT